MNNETEFSARHVEPQFDTGMSDQIAIGLITLSSDIVTEYELRRMLPPDGITLATTRIKTHNPITIENLAGHALEIAQAGTLYDPPGCIDVFAYACTSGSAISSQEELEAKLHASVPGAKLTSPMTGALRAFKALGIRKVSMLTPYPDDVAEIMIRCVEKAGVSVVGSTSFHIENDYEIGNIAPQCISEAAQVAVDPAADALFIPCTGFRTSSVIHDLEQRLGVPVITAHQAMLWDALTLAGFKRPLSGYGRLLTTLS
ncbi:maleate cis-trans isomerase family protein [Paraburkholderia sp. MM6662-R1]|uniref:maleate cis-trans isomerase family protein n=1 Tax=Paraburkholderia sp. MM6662-R1 TaxID=2991066 RepID=UPI003D21FAFD